MVSNKSSSTVLLLQRWRGPQLCVNATLRQWIRVFIRSETSSRTMTQVFWTTRVEQLNTYTFTQHHTKLHFQDSLLDEVVASAQLRCVEPVAMDAPLSLHMA